LYLFNALFFNAKIHMGRLIFLSKKIAGIQSLYRLFKEGHIDTPEYLVIEKACDRCEATAKKNNEPVKG